MIPQPGRPRPKPPDSKSNVIGKPSNSTSKPNGGEYMTEKPVGKTAPVSTKPLSNHLRRPASSVQLAQNNKPKSNERVTPHPTSQEPSDADAQRSSSEPSEMAQGARGAGEEPSPQLALELQPEQRNLLQRAQDPVPGPGAIPMRDDVSVADGDIRPQHLDGQRDISEFSIAAFSSTASSINPDWPLRTGPGWSYASAARSRKYPAHPLDSTPADGDLPIPAGAEASTLMKAAFLQKGPTPLEYPSRLTYVPQGPAQSGAAQPPRSPTWCLSCPPNRLTFSAAWATKRDVPEPVPQPDSRDYIGFATLPEQVHRKSVKRGFDFTLLVVGEAGLGKSTLINSLFLGDLYKDRRVPDVGERVEKTTQIEKKTLDIEERGVKLRLTIVDTPGFGDAVNCEESWRACVNYVDEQFRQYFTDENGLNRRNLQDNRVHCCLYFIPPYGHGLRQIDLEFMRRLHRKVNIVPVIAKADTLTETEVTKLKRAILADIEEHKIQMYQFPDCDSDEDEEFKAQDRELKACVPFAVVGSNTVLEVGGKKVRGRQYPWGVVEVENPKHSDFNKLRNMLITTHMQDLKDVTEDVHYENFRAQCISQISQQAIRERVPGKLKRDSGVNDAVISETDRLLIQKDEEIRRMQDMLAQMQEQLKQTSNKRDSIVNV